MTLQVVFGAVEMILSAVVEEERGLGREKQINGKLQRLKWNEIPWTTSRLKTYEQGPKQ